MDASPSTTTATTSSPGPNRDVLDLSRVVVRSEHELKRLMEKVPDFKIRAEKCIGSRIEQGFSEADGSPLMSASVVEPVYPFADPVPASMRDVDIRELGRVDINWRMLTTARPKNRTEEDIFTRFVQLEKLQYQTVKWENDEDASRERQRGGHHRGAIPRGRSRGGALTTSVGGGAASRGGSVRAAVTEIRLQTCRECGEEFCAGTDCKKYMYDDHARTLNPPSTDDIFRVGPARSKAKSRKMTAKMDTKSVDHYQQSSKVKSLNLVVSGEAKRASIKETSASRSRSQPIIKARQRAEDVVAVANDGNSKASTKLFDRHKIKYADKKRR